MTTTTYPHNPETLRPATTDRAPYDTPKTNKHKAICRGYRYGKGCGQTLAPGQGLLHKDAGVYMCRMHYDMRAQTDEQRPRRVEAMRQIEIWLGENAQYPYQTYHEIDRTLAPVELFAADLAEDILAVFQELPATTDLHEYKALVEQVQEIVQATLLAREEVTA